MHAYMQRLQGQQAVDPALDPSQQHVAPLVEQHLSGPGSTRFSHNTNCSLGHQAAYCTQTYVPQARSAVRPSQQQASFRPRHVSALEPASSCPMQAICTAWLLAVGQLQGRIGLLLLQAELPAVLQTASNGPGHSLLPPVPLLPAPTEPLGRA